jgi:hypothetical protein
LPQKSTIDDNSVSIRDPIFEMPLVPGFAGRIRMNAAARALGLRRRRLSRDPSVAIASPIATDGSELPPGPVLVSLLLSGGS